MKKDYEEFGDWFEKISKDGRKCWVYYRNGGSIGAILIYKFEEEPIDAKPSLPKKRILKLSTFKVTYVGNKIGELYIKSAIDISIRNDISEIYLTQFTKPEDRLVRLISEYGFYKAAVNRRGEDIFVKNLIVGEGAAENLSPRDIAKKFYPSFYDGKRVKKFIVPVRPEYHSRLFTDFRKRQTTIYEHSGEFIVEGNTIKKAYLTHSKAKRMSEGDILFFYRSRDWRSITSLGVIEAVYKETRDANQILQLVGKRTVYSKDEIAEMVKKSVSVILFKHHFHFKHSLHLNELKEKDILRGAPQSITEIGHESYVKIKEEGGIDERFTFN